MARDTSVDLSKKNPKLDPYRSKKWTIPPVLSEDPRYSEDQGFILTQGIVYEIDNCKNVALMQNVSLNEDDTIYYSFHGDKDGFWHEMNTHSLVEIRGNIFLLNRTHKENIRVSIIMIDHPL